MDFITERLHTLFHAEDEMARRYALIAVEAARHRCMAQLKRMEEVCASISQQCLEVTGTESRAEEETSAGTKDKNQEPIALVRDWEEINDKLIQEATEAYQAYLKTSVVFLSGRKAMEQKGLPEIAPASESLPSLPSLPIVKRRSMDRRKSRENFASATA